MSNEQRLIPAIHTCRYINLSDLLDGLPDEDAVRGQVTELPFSWGDNNHTLIDPAVMDRAIDEGASDDDCEAGMEALQGMLEQLKDLNEADPGNTIYIDMEG